MSKGELDSREIIDRIEAAHVFTKPFPHLTLENFFPDAVFAELRSCWPPNGVFSENVGMNRFDCIVDRKIGDFPSRTQPFWRAIDAWTTTANVSIEKKLRPFFRLKFEPYLREDWEEQVASLSLCPGGAQLSYYTGTVRLAPHVDHPILATNAFVYCNKPTQSEEDLGTILYRSRGLMLPYNIDVGADLAKKALEPEKIIPYQGNLFFAYLNGPTSFHGLRTQEIGKRERRILMFGNLVDAKDGPRLFGEAANS